MGEMFAKRTLMGSHAYGRGHMLMVWSHAYGIWSHAYGIYTFLSFDVRIRQKMSSYMNLAKRTEPMSWLGCMRYMSLIGVDGVYA